MTDTTNETVETQQDEAAAAAEEEAEAPQDENEGPAEQETDTSYTVDEVLKAGRHAIAADPAGDESTCYLHIFRCFHRVNLSRLRMEEIEQEEAPYDGWVHQTGCGCLLCLKRRGA